LRATCEEIADAYRSLDVLTSCSHNEGLPLNLIEAMALGVPVVAMATGGCREIVQR
jgi:glycosyltransferase involved in cell wall biosynthesis